MVQQSPSFSKWKITALLGAGLILIGVAAGYLDVVTDFRFEWISDSYGVVGWCILVGLLLSFVGLIGWAKQLGRGGRGRMGAAVFFAPWAVMLAGYPIAGTNMHGPAAIVMLLHDCPVRSRIDSVG